MSFQFVQPGMVIGGYQVVEKLHKGGMATLWRVRKTRAEGDPPADEPDRLMKVPFLGDHDDPTAIVSFEQECMIMPALQGIHVPRVLGSGDFSGQPYLLMELIEGTSLRPLLDAGPMPADQVAQKVAAVASAIHDLHSQGVIHLDIKPSNIMFRDSGDAVMIDYGLARHRDLPDLLAEEFRLPMGTGPYIAPEQVLRMRHDPRSDIFALGVMMYFMLTGERPFGQPTSIPGLKRRLWLDPTPPRAIKADCPLWMQEVILRCLEVKAEHRYSSAARLAYDLRNPDKVKLTARAERLQRDGFWTRFKRRFKSLGMEPSPPPASQGALVPATFLMVAVDLTQEWQALAEALRQTVEELLKITPDARLACVTVLKTHRIGLDERIDASGRNLHALKLSELQYWARPLQFADQITHHVLESPDPAQAILEFARNNNVDHIAIGSRRHRGLKRLMGSVSQTVVSECDCSVTVVRVKEREESEVQS